MEKCEICGKDLIDESECDNPDCYAYGSLVCGKHHVCEEIEEEELEG